MSKTISALTEATTFATTDIFAMVVGGNSRKVSISSLFAMVAKSTLAAGTLTADAPLQQTQTWNNAAVTFTGIKQNITDTASAAGSLLMDLQVGGTSQFNVAKNGRVSVASSVALDAVAGGGIDLNGRLRLGGTQLKLGAATTLNWTSSAIGDAADLVLARDAADTLAQRRSTNPQSFRLYNTYTNASNYERGFMRWVSNVLEIGVEGAGTGSTSRLIKIMGAAGTTLDIQSSATVTSRFGASGGAFAIAVGIGANAPAPDIALYRRAAGILALTSSIAGTGAASLEMVEQTAPSAPATNAVRIYAEDDGSGKTRLMALFATGAAQQIAIEP